MSTGNKIKQYKILRQMCSNQMSELKQFADRASDDKTKEIQFKMMYQQFEVIQAEFKKHHQSILSLSATQEDADIEAEEAIRREFEYFASYIFAIHYSLFENNESTREGKNEPPSANKPNVKLPKIEIPKFSGDITSFKAFIDMFKALVDENDSLADIEKFNYLVSFLQGPPLALVQCTPMSAENYKTAFESLINRYDNPRVIAFAHLRAIDNAPIITNSKNVKALRSLMDVFNENLAALNNMGFPVKDWDFLLFYLLSKHLDDETITRFEIEVNSHRSQIPTFESLKQFVAKQCNALETVEFSSAAKNLKFSTYKSDNKNKSNTSFYSSPKAKQSVTFFGNANKINCVFCNKIDHLIYRCTEFYNRSPQERLNIAKSNRWCTNCLSNQHSIKNCNSQSTCRYCHSKHHSLLHIYRNSAPANSNIAPISSQRNATERLNLSSVKHSPHADISTIETQSISTQVNPQNLNTESAAITSQINNNFCGIVSSASSVLLATAVAEILDSHGMYKKIRILIDCGSQSSYISQKCFKMLGLSRFDISLSISGLGRMQEVTTSGGVTCSLKPVGKTEPIITTEAFILPKLCPDIPSHFVNDLSWPHIANISLADPNFHQPGSIDLLLGAEVFPYILLNGRINGNVHEPVAINTIFGWVLMGKFVDKSPLNSSTTSFFTTVNNLDLFALDKSIKRFWEIEEVPKLNLISPEDELCEKIFISTHARDETGRYIVELPFKNMEPQFDVENSYSLAFRRFCSLEKRLHSNEKLFNEYAKIIREYLDSDYLELIPSNSKPENCYYLPHHGVIKDEKIRIVYDASAKTNQGFSLNDTLLKGPKLQKDIVSILLKFRLHNIVFTCDIKGMFTQIRLVPKHQNFQRILWRFSNTEPLQEYKLKRVTFGLSCSPFLANRCILQLARDEQENFPLASPILENDIYVDDIVTGCDSFVQAKLIQNQLINILKRGGFKLRKWASNYSDLLTDLPETDVQNRSVNFNDESDIVKILGLQWHPKGDTFSYNVNPIHRGCTKRNILSEIARVYDPLGFLTPVTLFTKCLMQNLWSLGLDWDEQPPPVICERWLQFMSDLPLLSTLKIPRQLLMDDAAEAELHGFCDASQKAYASIIYFRMSRNGIFQTFFVIAKSKVAPLKQISIPRLELSAAVLLADLISLVLKIFDSKIIFTKIFAWSDSTIALTWIKSPAYKWKQFVSNRVARIQEKVPPSLWYHLNSQDNPSDCASRGQMPSELLKNELYWAGPRWLLLPQESWPVTSFQATYCPDVSCEEKKLSFAAFNSDHFLDTLINKFSSFLKLQRIVSYVIRFIFNLKNPNTRKTKHFTIGELNATTCLLVKHVQYSYFSDDITNLKNNRPTCKMFRKLNSFLDKHGLLRVGGRLTKSALSYDQKHPAVLPKKSHLTTLIIEYFHKTYLHPGIQTLHFLLLQHFWILSPKRAIRKVISNCTTCWRLSPKSCQPPMGNLPTLRVSQIKPFSCVGVDYAGPFTITLGKTRGAKTFKSYLCLFVCFATKALHLELASDLSTEAFLAAFRRFIARRGRCSKIYSDCGSNFVGAQKQIVSLMQNCAESEAIEWHFNPPAAPHFSGLAEAGVKSVKTHLQRVIGAQILTFEEFYTVLVQIESLLNSRPLCPISSDPNDLTVLTPGHFLTLEPISVLPDPDLSHLKLNQLNRWQLLQRLHQDFWSRWHREYLHTLQQRGKWLDPTSPPVNIGTIVLLKDELSPPSKWHIGRITETHPGDDGVVRVATVVTKNGIFKRPLVKLCPLPEPQIC